MATYRYLATVKVNTGTLKSGMSVIIEKPFKKTPDFSEVRKAFLEQKGERIGYGVQSPNDYTITEIKA